MSDHILAGALGGLAGGMVMSVAMMLGKRTGIVQTPLPVRVERWAERQAGIPVVDRPRGMPEQGVAMGGHLLMSAALGAGYGALRSSHQLNAFPSGPLYGLGVYALNLGAVAPALGITPGPWNEEPTTSGRRLMMHLVYGAVTAWVTERLAPTVIPQREGQVLHGAMPAHRAYPETARGAA